MRFKAGSFYFQFLNNADIDFLFEICLQTSQMGKDEIKVQMDLEQRPILPSVRHFLLDLCQNLIKALVRSTEEET